MEHNQKVYVGEAILLTAGQRLRMLREQLGLTIRDVEHASERIAERHKNRDFALTISRISEIETKPTVPSIYRVYSLAVIYHRDLRELMSWYGIDVDDIAADKLAIASPRSRRSEALALAETVRVPLKLDPAFDPSKSANIARFVEQWGTVPLSYLSHLANDNYTYGYIGTDDFTMYPILKPGTFLQVDESRTEVVNGVWRSEFERPIYFVETRDGFTCAWCTLQDGQLVLQPHPLSPVPVRVLRCPQEAEVVGQVVGVAMKLGDWQPCAPGREPKDLPELP